MSAESEVRRRIQERGKNGKITFSEFMEIALYWPQGGYYTGREPVGAHGDWLTGAIFAYIIYSLGQAAQFGWLYHRSRPDRQALGQAE